MTLGEAEFTCDDPVTALDQAYERGENDEFVKPPTSAPKASQKAPSTMAIPCCS